MRAFSVTPLRDPMMLEEPIFTLRASLSTSNRIRLKSPGDTALPAFQNAPWPCSAERPSLRKKKKIGRRRGVLTRASAS